jgi:hypothetical protein
MTDDAITGLEGDLRTNGIDVESIDPGEPLELTYTTSFPGERVAHGEIGRVCNTFIDRAEDGRWEPVRVEATVVRFAGDVQGTWHADAEWFEGLLSYRLSEADFSERVLATLTHAAEDAPDGSAGADDTEESADETTEGGSA